jgi:hypothetical protein
MGNACVTCASRTCDTKEPNPASGRFTKENIGHDCIQRQKFSCEKQENPDFGPTEMLHLW